MEGIWIAVSFIFVFGTIAVTAFGIGRMFGGWHWPTGSSVADERSSL